MSKVHELRPWQKVWRTGISPLLTTPQLRALRGGLEGKAPCLIQGNTTNPAPLPENYARTVEGACAVAFALWQDPSAGPSFWTVRELEESFHSVAHHCDQIAGPGSFKMFVEWFDGADRRDALACLLREVNRSLALRIPGRPEGGAA